MKRRDLIEKVAASKYSFDKDEEVKAHFLEITHSFLSAFEFYGMLPPCRNKKCAMGWETPPDHVCDHSWETSFRLRF